MFAARGFAGTSLSEIGTAAGLSRGAPAYFFSSKNGVYEAVVRRGLERLGEAAEDIAAELRKGGPGADRRSIVLGLVDSHLEVLAQERDLLRILHRDCLDEWAAVRGAQPECDRLVERLEALWADALSAPAPVARRALTMAFVVLCAPFTGAPLEGALLGDGSVDALRSYAAVAAELVCAAL